MGELREHLSRGLCVKSEYRDDAEEKVRSEPWSSWRHIDRGPCQCRTPICRSASRSSQEEGRREWHDEAKRGGGARTGCRGSQASTLASRFRRASGCRGTEAGGDDCTADQATGDDDRRCSQRPPGWSASQTSTSERVKKGSMLKRSVSLNQMSVQ